MPRPRPIPVPAAPRLPSAAETLGPPPLIPGEERADYETMLARVTEAVRPDGIVEEAWVRDVVDLIWEAVRCRRLKAALLTSSSADGLMDVLHGLATGGVGYTSSRAWAIGDPEVVANVDEIFNETGRGLDHVMAHALRRNIDTIERIDRMAASAEIRRAATLREISHARARFAATLGAAADAAIADAEYAVVEPAGTEGAAQEVADAAE